MIFHHVMSNLQYYTDATYMMITVAAVISNAIKMDNMQRAKIYSLANR